ncbi:Metallo-beta-lactamase family protein, RNA-specific [Fulvivirga imtechensis AK7]|uniref:Metallo-beta-lactamase family protein, RNA-specific n=1 Tax=Fulvivirga imtechensis AK7 TaxID=1237149 RepID=L8JIE8_9BACT|nr:MBL fold metallo-hydrolase [Fulvivirga imtechensis]ELR68605.1 Metallo-beta-lactamase family protein, RNA-specific [Fulvivirga imtechensis AK7]
MNIRLKFLGGARSVTGSKYLLEIGSRKILIDCGLFQGHKDLRLRNWDALPVDANTIDTIILTHAHIDHSGYLPKIVKEGFHGIIHCTTATAGLLEIMLMDAAKLQEEEAGFAKKKGYSRHENPLPLFDTSDAEAALALIKGHHYKHTIEVAEGVSATFFNAGHILGSAIVVLEIQGKSQTKKIVFSGDLGRYDRPILQNPEVISEADILLVESTYGDRVNENEGMEDRFAELINQALERDGCLLIPAFAVGRTQLLLHYFKTFMEARKIPEVPIYVDSPMAISTTALYQQYPEYHKLSKKELSAPSIFDYPHIKYYRSQEASVSLNSLEKNAIIISASGMCTGGRILHHMYHRLPKRNDTLLFVGYQAEGTRGRRILNGEPTIRIFGIDVPVRCHIEHLDGLSAHADKNELLKWLRNFQQPPKMTFITHGEETCALSFSDTIKNELGWSNVYIPEYLESFELFAGV